MTEKPIPCAYILKEGVRVFLTSQEIRFRKGIWNFNEAVISLVDQEKPLIAFFNAVATQLINNQEVNIDIIAESQAIQQTTLNQYMEVLEGLKQQQFLYSANKNEATRIVSALLGGNLSGFEEFVSGARPVVFISDNDYAKNAALLMAKEINLPLDVLDEQFVRELSKVDLTTRTEAIEYRESLAKFEKVLSSYCCVVACISEPNLTMLRNLNRVLVKAEKPLILGMLDGPFSTVLSTLATQSGCFECYEQRMLARLEDTMVYHKYIRDRNQAGMTSSFGGLNGPWFSPPLHILTGSVISEAFLYSTLNMLRLAGRVISTYLPLLEIQAQDILRVPYCPACGSISTAEMDEMYTSSKQIISDMLASVELQEGDS